MLDKPEQVYFLRGKLVKRALPYTVYMPTSAQAEMAMKFAEIVKASKAFTIEEVAKLVNGKVIEINGKKFIEMPDKSIYLKQMALVKYYLKNYRSKNRKPLPKPVWYQNFEKSYRWLLPPMPSATIMIREGTK